MKKRIKKRVIAFGLAAALLIFYAGACSYLFFVQDDILFHPPQTPLDKKYTNFPAPFDEVWIPVPGAKLHGLYFHARTGSENPRGIIVFFHGNTQNAEDYGKTANEFTDQGLDYFIPDYRGFGKSTGHIENEPQFLNDMDVIYAWLKKKWPEDKIYIGGRSLGCAPASYLASKNHPKLTVMVSPFFNIAAMAEIRYPFLPKFLVRYTFRNDLWVAQSKSPVFLIHGTNDTSIPYQHSERLAQLIQAPHRYFSVPGAGHGDLQKFPLYHKILRHLMTREA